MIIERLAQFLNKVNFSISVVFIMFLIIFLLVPKPKREFWGEIIASKSYSESPGYYNLDIYNNGKCSYSQGGALNFNDDYFYGTYRIFEDTIFIKTEELGIGGYIIVKGKHVFIYPEKDKSKD